MHSCVITLLLGFIEATEALLQRDQFFLHFFLREREEGERERGQGKRVRMKEGEREDRGRARERRRGREGDI